MSLEKKVEALAQQLSRMEAALSRIEQKLNSGEGGSSGSSAAFVDQWDKLIADHFKPFVDLSKKIGGDIAQQIEVASKVVSSVREILVYASNNKKPDDAKFAQLLQPASGHIQSVKEFYEKNRKSKQVNHLNTLNEGIAAFGWVAQPLPAPFIGEMKGSSEFWSNKILKEFKGTDETHVNWVKAWNNFLVEMQAYAKNFHTQGLAWKK